MKGHGLIIFFILFGLITAIVKTEESSENDESEFDNADKNNSDESDRRMYSDRPRNSASASSSSKASASGPGSSASASAHSSASTGTYRIYNKNSGSWKTIEFLKDIESETSPEASGSSNSEEETSNNPRMSNNIKVGQRVNGWGRVAGPEECARPCRKGEQPKICYYEWTAEYYRTLGGACDRCIPKTNTSLATDCQCIYGDGYNISGITTINRMFPGPSVQVCLGDLVVVDVTNNIEGNQLTIHWHGIYQKNWQHYDGVPFLTQCPIQSATTFRYQWVAQNIGTHWWHSHTGMHQAKMLEGIIIIREPKEDDPNHRLYDHDDVDNTIFLSDWMHSLPDHHFPGSVGPPSAGQRPDNILINGQGQWMNPDTGKFTDTPFAVINVKSGQRYRFRMVNTGSWDCPMQLTIQDHNLTVIAVDGENVRPVIVNSITSFPAERFDFVLNANKRPGVYWIQVRLIGFCFDQEIIQLGILRYANTGLTWPQFTRPTYHRAISTGIILNDINEVCDGTNPGAVCIKDLESADPIDPRILAEKTDFQFFLPFTFYAYNESELYEPGDYKTFLQPGAGVDNVVPLIDGISNSLPTSPLLTQARDVPKSEFCHANNKPSYCQNHPVCECTHVIHVPLYASVEMIMYDEDRTANLSHPFHLHGYGFHVMSQGSQDHVQLSPANKNRALQLDRQKYKLASYSRPPVKDTLAIPPNGYTIVRFIADNPGYWFYHCHILPHLMTGMSLILHVGDPSDVPPTPTGFPTCGNYQPPIVRGSIL